MKSQITGPVKGGVTSLASPLPVGIKSNQRQWTSVHDQYQTLGMLGQGTYGVVYKAEHRITGEIVGLKRCRLDAFKEFGIPETTLREICLLKDLRHENIMGLYRISCNIDRAYLICEYLDLDLKKYLKTLPGGLPIKKVKQITYELFKGLAFCHGHRIIHRDLKPHNVLVSTDATVVKIADFGLARSSLAPGKTLTHEVITLWYRAPELLLGHCNYTSGVDIWSAGCIVAELLSMRPLFCGDSEVDTLFKIFLALGTPSQEQWPVHAVVSWQDMPQFNGNPRIFEQLSSELDEAGVQFLKKIFQFNPGDRPTALELLNHEWLRDACGKSADPPEPEWKSWPVETLTQAAMTEETDTSMVPSNCEESQANLMEDEESECTCWLRKNSRSTESEILSEREELKSPKVNRHDNKSINKSALTNAVRPSLARYNFETAAATHGMESLKLECKNLVTQGKKMVENVQQREVFLLEPTRRESTGPAPLNPLPEVRQRPSNLQRRAVTKTKQGQRATSPGPKEEFEVVGTDARNDCHRLREMPIEKERKFMEPYGTDMQSQFNATRETTASSSPMTNSQTAAAAPSHFGLSRNGKTIRGSTMFRGESSDDRRYIGAASSAEVQEIRGAGMNPKVINAPGRMAEKSRTDSTWNKNAPEGCMPQDQKASVRTQPDPRASNSTTQFKLGIGLPREWELLGRIRRSSLGSLIERRIRREKPEQNLGRSSADQDLSEEPSASVTTNCPLTSNMRSDKNQPGHPIRRISIQESKEQQLPTCSILNSNSNQVNQLTAGQWIPSNKPTNSQVWRNNQRSLRVTGGEPNSSQFGRRDVGGALTRMILPKRPGLSTGAELHRRSALSHHEFSMDGVSDISMHQRAEVYKRNMGARFECGQLPSQQPSNIPSSNIRTSASQAFEPHHKNYNFDGSTHGVFNPRTTIGVDTRFGGRSMSQGVLGGRGLRCSDGDLREHRMMEHSLSSGLVLHSGERQYDYGGASRTHKTNVERAFSQNEVTISRLEERGFANNEGTLGNPPVHHWHSNHGSNGRPDLALDVECSFKWIPAPSQSLHHQNSRHPISGAQQGRLHELSGDWKRSSSYGGSSAFKQSVARLNVKLAANASTLNRSYYDEENLVPSLNRRINSNSLSTSAALFRTDIAPSTSGRSSCGGSSGVRFVQRKCSEGDTTIVRNDLHGSSSHLYLAPQPRTQGSRTYEGCGVNATSVIPQSWLRVHQSTNVKDKTSISKNSNLSQAGLLGYDSKKDDQRKAISFSRAADREESLNVCDPYAGAGKFKGCNESSNRRHTVDLARKY